MTEAGSMNLFVLWMNQQGTPQLVTPPPSDHTILAGLSLASVLDLARERLVKSAVPSEIEPPEVIEKQYTILIWKRSRILRNWWAHLQWGQRHLLSLLEALNIRMG
ncbi:hypothetical protein N7499_009192 [Penicillium canescens]|nr:hypothetical protein N7499_009192 [Penicillium canescens]KAJ6169861.1 hypothetical protein N7485_007207 [Penicillium canescens]